MVKYQIVACFSHLVRLLFSRRMNICFKCLALLQINLQLQVIVHCSFPGQREDVLRNFTESSTKSFIFQMINSVSRVVYLLLVLWSVQWNCLVPKSTLKFMINYYSSSQIFWHQDYFIFLKSPPANARETSSILGQKQSLERNGYSL